MLTVKNTEFNKLLILIIFPINNLSLRFSIP